MNTTVHAPGIPSSPHQSSDGLPERGYGTATPSTATVLACAWPALLLATACLVPFLNKAFLIDDPQFLAMAQQILKSPLHPLDFVQCWNLPATCTKAYNFTPGNSLMGYALVPTVLNGSAEWIAHVTQLVFAWVAIIAMSSLVLRFGWSTRHAISGALLLVAIPPFLPMASTAMPDVLATAMALVAMERLAAWKAQRKWHQGAVAAIALGLAGMARVHLVLLLPLGAVFLIESTNPRVVLAQFWRKLFLWAPVLGGGLLLTAMVATTRDRGLGLDPPPGIAGLGNIPSNFRFYLLYFCFPLPLAACWAASRWITAPRRIAYVVAAAAAIALLAPGKPTWLLAAIGLCVLADLLFQSWKERDLQALFLILWLLIPLPVVYYAHLPIKYLLPCMPALILTCFRLGVVVPPRLARAAAVFLIVGATIYSVLILRSDNEFAEFGRAAMNSLIRPRVAAGEKVWYPGHFSAYWYAPLAGAELFVPGTSQPKAGDLLAVGIREAGAEVIRTYFPNRTLVQTLTHKYRFGRTMFEGMGLYSNRVGPWLWGFGDSDDDRYELWRVQ